MKIKYPRTFHLPWSEGATDDDKTHSLTEIETNFSGREVVVTEKLDGENTTIYADGSCHARSLDSSNHPSRDFVRAKAREISALGFPEGWRLLGENLYARHSIPYDRLPDFFVLFGIADDLDLARPWSEVEEWAALLGIPVAPVLYRGTWDAKTIRTLYPFPSRISPGSESEGYVVRIAGGFPMIQFAENVAKFVRANHVQTDTHWMHSEIVPNGRVQG